MNPAGLMKGSFELIGGNVPNDDVAFFSSGEESLSVGANGQGVEPVAMSVDSMFDVKLQVALANRCLSERERRSERDEQDSDRDAGAN